MEHKNRNEFADKPATRSRCTPFKRVIAMILVICLILTMPGCTSADGQPTTLLGVILGVVQGILLALGSCAIALIAWVFEMATGWQNQWTGWCMCGVSAFLFKGWARLVDPTHIFDDWSQMTKRDISFHDEHTELASWNDPGSYVEFGEDKLFANPGEGEILITYDANGGYYAPEDEIGKMGAKHKIPAQIPVRPGYHFMGWAYDYEKSDVQFAISTEVVINEDGQTVTTDKTQEFQNEVKYRPGKRTDEKLMADTPLKAVWKSHKDMIADLKDGSKKGVHSFTIKREKKSPYVTIKCNDCGMRYSDPCVEKSEFELMYGNGLFKTARQMNKLYDLYRAQNIGPLALKFNTMYYNADADQLDTIINNSISTAEDLQSNLDKISSTVEKYVTKAGAAGNSKDAVTEHLTKTYTQKQLKWAEDFFGDISDGTEKAGLALDAVKSAYALQKMFNKNSDVLEQTEGMLEFIECISSFTQIDSIVSPATNALKEGLKLVRKMDAIQSVRDASMGDIYANNPKQNEMRSVYLAHFFFPGEELSMNVFPYGELNQLLTGSEVGCWCDRNPSACDFNEAPYADGPSVAEILDRLPTAPEGASQQEKDILMYYLAERAAHELYMVTGMTLTEYAELIK